MASFTPNAYLVGGPVPIGSGVKDPRAVSLPAAAERAEVAAADGSCVHVWTRTGRIRSFESLPLREYVYAGPAEADS